MGATPGSIIGRTGASALKAIPGIGTILGIGSQVVFAGASTYALGKVFQSHFDENGNLFNLNVDKMKDRFKGFMDNGKTGLYWATAPTGPWCCCPARTRYQRSYPGSPAQSVPPDQLMAGSVPSGT